MSKNKEFYRKALDVLNERGLWKGTLINPDSGKEVCAFGACAVADGKEIVAELFDERGTRTYYYLDDFDLRDLFEEYPELVKAAKELFPDRIWKGTAIYAPHFIVPDVNDNPNTTLEDVQSIIKRAEELAED